MGRILMYLFFFLGASLRWSFNSKEKSLKATIEEMRLFDAAIGVFVIAIAVLCIRWIKGT